MNKLVSILIPVYNRDRLIEETVQSAINQTYENIEVIIVDNKSTDNTWAVLQRLSLHDKRIKIFQNENNIGPVRNWKRCIDEASGEYGKILWSDDLIASDYLVKTVPYLENKDVGFVFTGTEIFKDGTAKKTLQYFIGESGIFDSEKYINGVLFGGNYPVSPGCALFRLKDLKENLLIDIPNRVGIDFSTQAIGNDLLLFLLTAHQYNYFAFVNETLSFFRDHDGSISVQSKEDKLSFYYNIASAYFIENYRKDLIRKMNSKIWLYINFHKQNSIYYKLNNIHNYYVNNRDFKISYRYIIKKIIKKIIFIFRSIFSSLFRS